MARTRTSSASVWHKEPRPSTSQREYSGGTFYLGEYVEAPSDTYGSLENARKSTIEQAQARYKLYGDLYREALDKKKPDEESKRKARSMRQKERRRKSKGKEHRERHRKKGRIRRFIRRLLGGDTREETLHEEKREDD